MAQNYSLTHMSTSTEYFINREFNVDSEWVDYERSLGTLVCRLDGPA